MTRMCHTLFVTTRGYNDEAPPQSRRSSAAALGDTGHDARNMVRVDSVVPMSTLEEKLEQHAPARDDMARRTYASLQCCRGFRSEPVSTDDGRRVVSIATMSTRSFWAHNGQGKWTAGGATYEKIREEVK